MTRGPRIAIAILATIILMPCMGFSFFGFFHSFESPPDQRWPWLIAYGGFELIALALIVTAWWWALRYIPPLGGTCLSCGFSLRANTTGTCPECGKPTAT